MVSLLPDPGWVGNHPYQNKHEPEDIHGLIVRRIDADDAKHVGQELEEGRDDNHPTIAFAMDNSLGHVGAESEAKENGKEICGWKTWAKGPLGCFLVFEH